jgi:hypothetical protein
VLQKAKTRGHLYQTASGVMFDNISRVRLLAAAGAAWDCYATTHAGVVVAAGLDWHLSADRPWDTDDLGFDNLTWDAFRLGNHAGFANLTAGRVRNSSCANFLLH